MVSMGLKQALYRLLKVLVRMSLRQQMRHQRHDDLPPGSVKALASVI